jgi:hypothetical protein
LRLHTAMKLVVNITVGASTTSDNASSDDIERWHKSLKGECIRPGTPLSLDYRLRRVSGAYRPAGSTVSSLTNVIAAKPT